MKEGHTVAAHVIAERFDNLVVYKVEHARSPFNHGYLDAHRRSHTPILDTDDTASHNREDFRQHRQIDHSVTVEYDGSIERNRIIVRRARARRYQNILRCKVRLSFFVLDPDHVGIDK